jgi:hypothetical protein
LPAKGVSYFYIPFGKTEFDLFNRGGEIPHILILRLRAFSFSENRQVLFDGARCTEVRRLARLQLLCPIRVLGGTSERHGLESAPFLLPGKVAGVSSSNISEVKG